MFTRRSAVQPVRRDPHGPRQPCRKRNRPPVTPVQCGPASRTEQRVDYFHHLYFSQSALRSSSLENLDDKAQADQISTAEMTEKITTKINNHCHQVRLWIQLMVKSPRSNGSAPWTTAGEVDTPRRLFYYFASGASTFLTSQTIACESNQHVCFIPPIGHPFCLNLVVLLHTTSSVQVW